MHGFCFNFIESINSLSNYYLTHDKKLQAFAGLNRFKEKLSGKMMSAHLGSDL
jgi:hypothetical protein